MNTILKLLTILTIVFIGSLSAGIDECKSDLYYANGIMMNETEQNATRMWKFTVKDLLSAKTDLFDKIAGVKVAYNRSQGFMDDVTESFEQMMSNEWDWQTFSLYFGIYLTEKGFQEDWIPHIEDLNKQINSYKESIGLGHGVIVLAHSQGNFYTNEAYDGLDDWMKSYFHMMGVATPADHVAGDGPYVKFHNDIINLIPTSLPSNREDTRHHGFPSYDAHDFFESYLKEVTTQGDIVGFIEQKIEEHTNAPSQWQTNQESNKETCGYKITVKHRFDPTIEMPLEVYPFAPNQKLYQVNGEYVKASCGGETILGLDHDIPEWDGKQDNECYMIDNPQKEKIISGQCAFKVSINNAEETCYNSDTFKQIGYSGSSSFPYGSYTFQISYDDTNTSWTACRHCTNGWTNSHGDRLEIGNDAGGQWIHGGINLFMNVVE